MQDASSKMHSRKDLDSRTVLRQLRGFATGCKLFMCAVRQGFD